jgi:hypothetical protein
MGSRYAAMMLSAQRPPPPKGVAKPISAIHVGRQAAPFRYWPNIKTGRANDRSHGSRSLPRHNQVMSPAANGSRLQRAAVRARLALRGATRRSCCGVRPGAFSLFAGLQGNLLNSFLLRLSRPIALSQIGRAMGRA